MRMMKVLAVLASMTVAGANTFAHIHTTPQSVQYDYRGLKGGVNGNTDCCDDEDCQPVELGKYWKDGEFWYFKVLKNPKNPNSEQKVVKVPDWQVTKGDPFSKGAKGIAHWCGQFYKAAELELRGDEEDYQKEYYTKCAFVPVRKETS